MKKEKSKTNDQKQGLPLGQLCQTELRETDFGFCCCRGSFEQGALHSTGPLNITFDRRVVGHL